MCTLAQFALSPGVVDLVNMWVFVGFSPPPHGLSLGLSYAGFSSACPILLPKYAILQFSIFIPRKCPFFPLSVNDITVASGDTAIKEFLHEFALLLQIMAVLVIVSIGD